jgi:hypothetical protein
MKPKQDADFHHQHLLSYHNHAGNIMLTTVAGGFSPAISVSISLDPVPMGRNQSLVIVAGGSKPLSLPWNMPSPPAASPSKSPLIFAVLDDLEGFALNCNYE